MKNGFHFAICQPFSHSIQLAGNSSTVEIIARMSGLEGFKPDESSRAAFNNQVLSSMVWAALTKDDRTNVANLRVVADNGIATISGNAVLENTRKAIEEVCLNVDGVKEVINETGIGTDWQW